MPDEQHQFERSQVWDLALRTSTQVIGTKWVFKNKLDKDGLIIRKQSKTGCKGYNQEEAQILMKPMHQWP